MIRKPTEPADLENLAKEYAQRAAVKLNEKSSDRLAVRVTDAAGKEIFRVPIKQTDKRS